MSPRQRLTPRCSAKPARHPAHPDVDPHAVFKRQLPLRLKMMPVRHTGRGGRKHRKHKHRMMTMAFNRKGNCGRFLNSVPEMSLTFVAGVFTAIRRNPRETQENALRHPNRKKDTDLCINIIGLAGIFRNGSRTARAFCGRRSQRRTLFKWFSSFVVKSRRSFRNL